MAVPLSSILDRSCIIKRQDSRFYWGVIIGNHSKIVSLAKTTFKCIRPLKRVVMYKQTSDVIQQTELIKMFVSYP